MTTLLKKECPFCDESFTTYQTARRHVLRVHRIPLIARTVRDRNKGFLSFTDANVAQYPNASIAFSCLSCFETFNDKQQLSSHMMAHISRNAPQQPVVPSETHRWIVDNQDISMKFHQFRERCLQLNKYRLDEHFNELLSASGIFVLQKRFDFQVLPTDLFPPDLLQAMRRDVINEHYSGDSFNPVQLLRIKEILANFIDDVINEDKARMQLLDLCETLNDYERGVVRAIVGLIPAIYDCNMRALSEAHFSASYIHPLMTGLFSCKRPSKVAHCSNIVADENATINNNRPDYKVDVYEAYEYAYTNVYGEIKPTKNISSSLLVNDFCRVATFCKDACDELKLDHVIGFQVAGPSITWFVMHLQQDQLYTFTEIAAIDIPMKKSELLNLVGRLDDLMLVVKIHKTLCSPSTTIADNLLCPAHPLWYAGNRSETKSNKKRKVSLTLGD